MICVQGTNPHLFQGIIWFEEASSWAMQTWELDCCVAAGPILMFAAWHEHAAAGLTSCMSLVCLSPAAAVVEPTGCTLHLHLREHHTQPTVVEVTALRCSIFVCVRACSHTPSIHVILAVAVHAAAPVATRWAPSAQCTNDMSRHNPCLATMPCCCKSQAIKVHLQEHMLDTARPPC